MNCFVAKYNIKQRIFVIDYKKDLKQFLNILEFNNLNVPDISLTARQNIYICIYSQL